MVILILGFVLGRDRPFLEEQEEQLHRILSRVDSEVKREVLNIYSVTKQHYWKQLEEKRHENHSLQMVCDYTLSFI